MTEPLAIPVLTGHGVTLRPHLPTDLVPVLERCLDPDTQRFTTIPLEYTEVMARSYLADVMRPSATQIVWAIERDGAYAGTIDLRSMGVHGGAGNLGFVTHPAHRGLGVMSGAVRLVVGHALDTLGWGLVQWKAHAGNWASAKAVWRCGFPVPAFVPDLLVERGRVIDGWISTLHAGDPRDPSVAWDEVYAALAPTAPDGP
jgi:RimJ/RimL family protein N-acetyltransferase